MSLRALRTGRLVEVDERGRATFLTCPWIVQVPSGHPEPDSPADLWVEIECDGRMYEDPPDGQRCEHGHEFGNLERRLAPFGPEWEREQIERRDAAQGLLMGLTTSTGRRVNAS